MRKPVETLIGVATKGIIVLPKNEVGIIESESLNMAYLSKIWL